MEAIHSVIFRQQPMIHRTLAKKIRAMDVTAVRTILAHRPNVRTYHIRDYVFAEMDECLSHHGVSLETKQRSLSLFLRRRNFHQSMYYLNVPSVHPSDDDISAIEEWSNGSIAMAAVQSLFRNERMTCANATRLLRVSPGSWNQELVRACVFGGASKQELNRCLHRSAFVGDDVTFQTLLEHDAQLFSRPFGCSILCSIAVGESFSPKILTRVMSVVPISHFFMKQKHMGFVTPAQAAFAVCNNEFIVAVLSYISHEQAMEQLMKIDIVPFIGALCTNPIRVKSCRALWNVMINDQ